MRKSTMIRTTTITTTHIQVKVLVIVIISLCCWTNNKIGVVYALNHESFVGGGDDKYNNNDNNDSTAATATSLGDYIHFFEEIKFFDKNNNNFDGVSHHRGDPSDGSSSSTTSLGSGGGGHHRFSFPDLTTNHHRPEQDHNEVPPNNKHPVGPPSFHTMPTLAPMPIPIPYTTPKQPHHTPFDHYHDQEVLFPDLTSNHHHYSEQAKQQQVGPLSFNQQQPIRAPIPIPYTPTTSPHYNHNNNPSSDHQYQYNQNKIPTSTQNKKPSYPHPAYRKPSAQEGPTITYNKPTHPPAFHHKPTGAPVRLAGRFATPSPTKSPIQHNPYPVPPHLSPRFGNGGGHTNSDPYPSSSDDLPYFHTTDKYHASMENKNNNNDHHPYQHPHPHPHPHPTPTPPKSVPVLPMPIPYYPVVVPVVPIPVVPVHPEVDYDSVPTAAFSPTEPYYPATHPPVPYPQEYYPVATPTPSPIHTTKQVDYDSVPTPAFSPTEPYYPATYPPVPYPPEYDPVATPTPSPIHTTKPTGLLPTPKEYYPVAKPTTPMGLPTTKRPTQTVPPPTPLLPPTQEEELWVPKIETRISTYTAEWGTDVNHCQQMQSPDVVIHCHNGGVISVVESTNALCWIDNDSMDGQNDSVQCAHQSKDDPAKDSSIVFTCSGIQQKHLFATVHRGNSHAVDCEIEGNAVQYTMLRHLDCTVVDSHTGQAHVDTNLDCSKGMQWIQGTTTYCASPVVCVEEQGCDKLELRAIEMSSSSSSSSSSNNKYNENNDNDNDNDNTKWEECSQVDPTQDLQFYPFAANDSSATAGIDIETTPKEEFWVEEPTTPTTDEGDYSWEVEQESITPPIMSSLNLVDWRISGSARGCLWESSPMVLRCGAGYGQLTLMDMEAYPYCSRIPENDNTIVVCKSFAPLSLLEEESISLEVSCSGTSEEQVILSIELPSLPLEVQCDPEGLVIQSVMLSRGCGDYDTDDFIYLNAPDFCQNGPESIFQVDETHSYCVVGESCELEQGCSTLQLPPLVADTASARNRRQDCLYIV